VKLIRVLASCAAAFLFWCAPAFSQDDYKLERLLGIPAVQKPLAPLPPPEGFQQHITDGKLVLSLDDAIHLALANNTDIRIDQTAINTAQNNVFRQYQLFDPVFNGSFSDQRQQSQTNNELQGTNILNNLSQITQFGYTQIFPTGTNFQTTFSATKFSTNNGFYTVNPSFTTSWQFQITQPLLKNFGTFPNKAPIYIAQRNLREDARNVARIGRLGGFFFGHMTKLELSSKQCKPDDESARLHIVSLEFFHDHGHLGI
jgi:hypothetical protein